MRYFQNFPPINYTTTEIQNGLPQQIVRVIPNMTVRLQSVIDLGGYEWYKIQDRDRPDLLSAQWYGSSRYAWVIMLSNNMRDLYDWPLTNLEFYNYMAQKYESASGAGDGAEQSQTTIYQYLWKNPNTAQELVVDVVLYDTLPFNQKRTVSIYEYESLLNDQRRDIKQLHPETFQVLLQQFEKLMGGL